MAKTHSVDLTCGSVTKKLISFAIPLWFSALLQQLYHAADVIVVGNFAADSTTALAAVGSAGSITSLLLNLFLGLSIGASVRCANLYGAGDKKKLRHAMTTALISATVSGVVVMALGLALTRPILILMGSPDSVLESAVLYTRIICLGQPAVLLYNVCAGIMRAHGESKRPMYIITATGVVNVVLNLVLVIVFHLDVAGVAIATITSHYLSAAVTLFLLFSPSGDYRLRLSRFRFVFDEFSRILKVGLPAGLNGVVFNFSNMVVLSAVYALGDVATAAVSTATSVAAIFYTLPNAFSSACVSFSGQNYGARRFDRIDKLLWSGICISTGIFFAVDVILTLFPEFFLGLYTSQTDVIETAIPKLLITCWGYLIYGVSEMANGCQRGFGKSMGPTVLNIVAICGVRILWTLLVYPYLPANLTSLYLCYPLSWLVSAIAQMISYYRSSRKKMRLAALQEL